MANEKHIEVLQAARNLLAKPEAWIKGDYSNDDNTCFCGLGAVGMAQNGVPSSVLFANPEEDCVLGYLETAVEKLFPGTIPDGNTFAVFNDKEERTHQEVLQAFDLAIQLAQKDDER